MIETGFRDGDDLPVTPLGRGHELIGEAPPPAVAHPDSPADVRADQRMLELGAVHLSTVTFPPAKPPAAARLIRPSDPELYHVTLTLQGGVRVTQAGCDAMFSARDLYLHDTSRPYEIRAADGHGPVLALGAHVPRVLLPLPVERVDRLIARRISGGEGIGALLASFLTRLAGESGPYRPADGPRLGTVLLDLLTALLAHELDADGAVSPSALQRPLSLRIQDFIRRHLNDAQLTPGAIAAAHHISPSYLYRLFHDQGTTVRTWIRHERLDRCRRDLTDPALCALPIRDIASRWGFTHAADFSRAFRKVYGVTPTDYRHTAHHPRRGTTVKKVSSPC